MTMPSIWVSGVLIRIGRALAINTACCVIAIEVASLIPSLIRGWPYLRDFVQGFFRQLAR
jgi:hypothetical protein